VSGKGDRSRPQPESKMSVMRLSSRLRSVVPLSLSSVRFDHHGQIAPALRDSYYPKLGNRDIVGYGWNGLPTYMDRVEFPAPAVRFQENTKEVLALRQKELGDWKALSLQDKKALYRASYRMTYAEMNAPTGEWKSVLAAILFGFSVTGWIAIFIKRQVLPELPHTITREWQEKQLELLIKQGQGAVTGLSSHWDYENNRWK